MPKQKILPDKIKEAIDLYSRGLTIKDVAKEVGISEQTVNRYLKEAAVDTAGRDHPSLLLLRKITNDATIAEAEEKIGLPRNALPAYLYEHRYRSRTIISRLGPKLQAAYPDK
jgi:transcriptional regulator with XRE-family HTH domain